MEVVKQHYPIETAPSTPSRLEDDDIPDMYVELWFMVFLLTIYEISCLTLSLNRTRMVTSISPRVIILYFLEILYKI